MRNNIKILVVDDNPEIREIVHVLLKKEGFCVQEAEDGQQVFSLLVHPIDLIILDVMIPGKSGFEVCKKIRRISTAPILFLTAKAEDVDKEMGFACGGDDYLVKPFSSSELVARVKALLRRYFIYQGKLKNPSSNIMEIGDLYVDFSNESVFLLDQEIKLTNIEYKILKELLLNRKDPLSAQEIYESIWAEPFLPVSNNTIMVHIKNIRKKIEKNHHHPKYIKTIWGKGYQID